MWPSALSSALRAWRCSRFRSRFLRCSWDLTGEMDGWYTVHFRGESENFLLLGSTLARIPSRDPKLLPLSVSVSVTKSIFLFCTRTHLHPWRAKTLPLTCSHSRPRPTLKTRSRAATQVLHHAWIQTKNVALSAIAAPIARRLSSVDVLGLLAFPRRNLKSGVYNGTV